jgi:hypothetical protein
MGRQRVLARVAGITGALALIAVAGYAVSGAAAHVTGAVVAADRTYTDPAGDAQGGPDLTTVTVSDDASGRITFHIAAQVSNTSAFAIFLDPDLNGQISDDTGRIIILVATPSAVMPLVMRGSDSSQMSVPVAASISGTDIAASFAKTDMNIDKMFAFLVSSIRDDASDTADRAPDGNMAWVYALSSGQQTTTTTTTTSTTTTQVKAVIGAPKVTGSIAAGKRITVSFPVTRSDTGETLTSGKLTCDPSVQGKVVAHAESFTGGTARLSFTIPKNAKGKQLKVKVTITVGSQSTTRVATFHIS